MINEEEILDMSADQYIPYLFNSCEDNVLTVVRYDELDEPWHLKYTMDWSASDVDGLVEKFRQLRAILDRLALMHDALAESDSPEKMIPAEEFAIWNIYVRPFVGFDVPAEELQELIERDMAYDLDDEEQETLERYYEWLEEESNKRLQGKHEPAYRLINRTRRYERLVSLNAPEVVVENEARAFAEEFVIFYHGIG